MAAPRHAIEQWTVPVLPCRRCCTSRRASGARAAFLFGGGKRESETAGETSAAPKPPQLSPSFSVLRCTSAYELRVYDAFVAARTPYSTRADGLQRLSEYLDGRANATGVRLPATSPVFTFYSSSDGVLTKHMELMVSLPPGETQTPSPVADSGVQLRIAGGGEILAALEMRGNVTPEAADAGRTRLVAALAQDGLALVAEEAGMGAFRLATYGPLYSLAPRRNELMVRVQLG